MSLRFTKLTRPAVRALELGQKLAEHGIIAERLASGDIRYSVNIMVDGQRVHRVIGRDSEGVTREQAERAIEKFRTEARAGRLDLPQGRKLHRSFKEAASDYLKRLEETGGKDMANKRRHLEQHLVPVFGSQRLDQLKDFALLQYRKKRRDSGATDATVNREFSTLMHLFNRAVEWKWLPGDKVPKIEKPREARKQIRVLTQQQSDALMKAAIQDQDGRLWLFVAFGLGAAMRHSEIVRVRYDEIDFATRRIWINKAKAGEREQPITPALAEALKHQRETEDDPNGYVFPAHRRAKLPYRRDMRIPFERAVARAKLDPQKVTPHVMRHTAITRLVQAGTDIPTIQRISGHKTVGMVLHYTHVHGVHIDNAIEALNTPFPGTLTPELHTPADPEQPDDRRIVGIISGKTAA
ncbi:MAG: phage integrase family protein [Sphingomonadaceae bacterium]|nr:phage integrase family protein [Sphingomonadaceae bacterium]